MDMYEWEEFFQPHILERGWKYANNGAVADLKKNDDSITAVVRGSEYYKVEIDYSNNIVSGGYCSCPYASGGEWCKHMAAVLYTVDSGMQPKETVKTEWMNDFSPLTSIKEVIKSASRKEIETMLVALAYEDDKIESRIRAVFGSVTGSSDTKMIKKEIDEIFRVYSNRGYIDYHCAFGFENDLNTLLRNRIGGLIDAERYMDAFDISMYAYIRLGNQDIDDDGEIASISSACYELWQDIVTACTPEERKKIREWFEEHSDDGTVIDYMEDTLQDFLKYELATEDELKNLVIELEKLVERSRGKTECETVWSSYYGYSTEAIDLRNIFVKRLGATDEEIEDYMRKYMSFRSVRKHFMKKSQEQRTADEEIALLKESKKYDKESSYFLHLYSERLIELYKENHDFDSEKRERREDILSNQSASLEDLRAFREMCSDEEWEREKTKIIASRKSVDKKCEFLAEEKMLDGLFDEIWAQKDKLNLVNKYGFIMADTYSEQILDFYNDYVSQLAERACNRSRYDELVRYLRRMSQYPKGKEMAKRLSEEWIEMYPTRKVMVHELSNW